MTIATPDALIISTQRSGTHLLESLLASHPKVRKRSECYLRYELWLKSGRPEDGITHRFTNAKGKLNVAIIMYDQLARQAHMLENFDRIKKIHLIRNPHEVALSVLRYKANKRLCQNYTAHFRGTDEISCGAVTEVDEHLLKQLAVDIAENQCRFSEMLKLHKNVLTVTYEGLTGGCSVKSIPDDISREIQRFLNLRFHKLETKLVKTPVGGVVLSNDASPLAP